MRRHSVALGIVPLVMYLTACGTTDLCGNEIIAKVASPSGTHEAVVFERSCGATTGWSTHVAVVRRESPILAAPTFWRATQPGNVLVIQGRAKRGDISGTTVTPTWTDESHLAIAYDAGTDARSLAEVVDTVSIERRAVEPGP